MNILFEEKILHFDKQPTVSDLIKHINSLLADSYYFSHIIVNGAEVFGDIESFLNDYQINEIDTLEVITRTKKDLIQDILISAEQYTKRAKPEIEKLAEGFYQNPNQDTWNRFSELIEGLQWLNKMFEVFEETTQRPKSWENNNVLAKIKHVLCDMEVAAVNKDYVLVGDIIQYELYNIIEDFNSIINNTIIKEGIVNDFN